MALQRLLPGAFLSFVDDAGRDIRGDRPRAALPEPARLDLAPPGAAAPRAGAGLGQQPDSADFAARHRFSIGLAFLPPQVAVRAAAYFREAAAAAGWAAAPEHIVYRTFA